MKRFILFCFLAVVALATFTPVGRASVAVAAGSSKLCAPVSGVKWVAPSSPHASGTQYDLHVSGKVTYTQATGYVKKIVARHVHTNQPFAGGPHGWTCKASASKTGLAYTRTCNPKTETFDASDYFTWTVGSPAVTTASALR